MTETFLALNECGLFRTLQKSYANRMTPEAAGDVLAARNNQYTSKRIYITSGGSNQLFALLGSCVLRVHFNDHLRSRSRARDVSAINECSSSCAPGGTLIPVSERLLPAFYFTTKRVCFVVVVVGSLLLWAMFGTFYSWAR